MEYLYVKNPEELPLYNFINIGCYVVVCESIRSELYHDLCVLQGNWMQFKMCSPYYMIYLN